MVNRTRVIGALVVIVLAGCGGGAHSSLAPSLTPSLPASLATATPALTAVPGGSPSPHLLRVAGITVNCGTLVEFDCRGVVSAFGAIADGATNAEIGGPICDGKGCPTALPADLVVGVILRWGEGDLTKVLTCIRATRADDFQCERAPIDLG